MSIKKIHIAIFLTICLLFSIQSYAIANYISKKLIPSVRQEGAYEIGEINFVGNKAFEEDFLKSIISQKPTSRSFPHKVLQAYFNESKKNRAAPRVMLKHFNIAIKSLEHEIRYFDQASVEADTLTLWHFYNTQGFHKINIKYRFVPDFRRKLNVLTFYVSEGEQFLLDTIVFNGLNDLPYEVARNLAVYKSRFRKKYFNEQSIIAEIGSIHDELLNSGYYFASYEKPIVSMDTLENKDSLTVNFKLGARVKFGEISFADSLRGQHIVTREMKKRQLEFQSGQWYSRRKLNTSVDNLLSLGTFETVSIDTCNFDQANADTVLNFCVESLYRKQKEWGVALFTNHTPLTNFNAGVEGTLNHRNLFGMAQTGNFFTTFSFKDILRIIEDIDNLDYEMQIGARFVQPLLWTVDNTRIGISTSLTYSVRTVNNFFQLNTIQFPVKFPINLPKRTFFNNMSIDFIFEREDPVNFKSAIANSLSKINNPNDSLRFIEAVFLYNNLHQYLQEPQFHLWTSNTIGFSLMSDKKNDPFNPSKGSYTFIGVDGWNIFLSHPSISGIARYFRFQFLHNHYFTVANNFVAAFKGRLGAIKLMEEANVYVPIDRQFFAGGSNSVRGWQSRTLRYTKITADSLGSRNTYQYMQNFVGNGGLLEGSIEFRYKLSRPKGINDFLAEHIGNLGVTAFLDFGNAFHWYLGIENMEMKVTDYFTKLAASVGLGIGYNTPVGPIRVDFATPVYDPMKKEEPFRKVVFHFGIGHSF